MLMRGLFLSLRALRSYTLPGIDQNVTGPSLMSETAMDAANSPVRTIRPESSSTPDKRLVQFFCPHRVFGLLKGRAVALAQGRGQRELGDHEHPSLDVHDRKVHFSLFIREDPERQNLLHQIVEVLVRVAFHRTEKHEQALADLAGDPSTDLDTGSVTLWSSAFMVTINSTAVSSCQILSSESSCNPHGEGLQFMPDARTRAHMMHDTRVTTSLSTSRDSPRREIDTVLSRNLGQKPGQGTRVAIWLFRKRIEDFDSMADLNRPLPRTAEAAVQDIAARRSGRQGTSEDGTEKLLYRLDDGNTVEGVLIPGPGRLTLCVSSQVGCASGCGFCRTGGTGLVRNLTRAEIVNQVFAAQKKASAKPITNIVLMGTGEPLSNYDAGQKVHSDSDGPERDGVLEQESDDLHLRSCSGDRADGR